MRRAALRTISPSLAGTAPSTWLRTGIPASQMLAVARHVVRQKLAGRRRYPLVLMLEPLLKCNLACAGCGKIQYPADVLKRQLSVDECLAAADECGAPIVSIAGGEPLLHPELPQIVRGLVQQKRFIYLCTNGILLEQQLASGAYAPSEFLSFSVHVDGLRAEHDRSVCRDGVHDRAVGAIREALRRGFRVTTNTTIFEGASPFSVRQLFDELTELGVEAMMISPGYAYSKAPDQEHFLARERTTSLFRRILAHRDARWTFNHSPLFLEFLMGRRDYDCTPWGNPTFNVFGWQKPCYLLQEGYAKSFRELMEETKWEAYGHHSGNPKCRDCMVHSGFEPSAVDATFSSLVGLGLTAKAMATGS